MKDNIKKYWKKLVNECAEKYNEVIFSDYDKSSEFVKIFKDYLDNLLEKYPSNVDVVCILATVLQELRSENKAILLLEDFIKNFGDYINDKDKARIYTNLAFYYDGDDKGIEYLQKAEKLNSPFLETYKALALHYFSNYQDKKISDDLEKSLRSFEKALKIDNSYEMIFGYAVCLFQLKQYEKAKEIFEELLIKYPDRMRLILSIAYCEVYLGNKESALCYLKQVKDGQDEKYFLSTDDIGDYQIYDVYYVLEEYELFLEECEKIMVQYFFNDGDYYYYALWILGQTEKFEEEIEKQKSNIVKAIKNVEDDEDFEDEEEKNDYIKSYQEDLENLIEMEHKIKNENCKPIVKLELYPEYGCYLVDCIRHNF